ncbi:flagellar basal body rod protein FlgB [Variovorax sp. PAMC 28711]|uniref:flagellar basal body rod protein FlgB n=1 Tax=Variovorax sp. PAMC 28711 TaxID=1795631 RepID=UPI0014388FCE|nr:flagellar basal body rod protein FlgB [Variovorax sp. PAMC 28711]
MLSLALQPSSTSHAKADVEDFAAEALLFRARRQALLASNVANADTPNFKARDADFAESLKEATTAALPSGVRSVSMTTTAGRHIASPVTKVQSTLEFGRIRMSEQTAADGNTVDMDIERGEIAKNTILYQLALMGVKDEAEEFKAATSDPGRR